YKGVKGRASVRISEDVKKNATIVEKINLKYLGTLDHPLARSTLLRAHFYCRHSPYDIVVMVTNASLHIVLNVLRGRNRSTLQKNYKG
ncbi:MAG: hypothetical protein ACREBU_16445, partial [Nitrososphaera sp.]